MAKTKPIGVRFRQDILESLKEKYGVDSPQKSLVFLERFYVSHNGELPQAMKHGLREAKYPDIKPDSIPETLHPVPDVRKYVVKTQIETQVAELEKELSAIPKPKEGLGLRRATFLQGQIAKLKKQLL